MKQQIEVYRQPQNPTGKLTDCHYGDLTVYRAGAAVTPLGRANLALPVDQMLG